MKIIFTILILISASVSFSQNSGSYDEHKFMRYYRPAIEFSYGNSVIKLDGLNPEISDAGMFELKLGFTKLKPSNYSEDLLKFENRFVFLGNADKETSVNQNNEAINSTMWRFGFGSKESYGLKTGFMSVIPYNSNSFEWSKFDYDTLSSVSGINYGTLNDFNGTFRFGKSAEAGIIFQLTKGFSIAPMYEISDIYPRHVFFKQSVSTLIEFTGFYLLESFTRLIIRNSPAAGVFVNFILKSAYEYGFYQLTKVNMDWPFTNAAPLRYNTFKVGMNFTF